MIMQHTLLLFTEEPRENKGSREDGAKKPLLLVFSSQSYFLLLLCNILVLLRFILGPALSEENELD